MIPACAITLNLPSCSFCDHPQRCWLLIWIATLSQRCRLSRCCWRHRLRCGCCRRLRCRQGHRRRHTARPRSPSRLPTRLPERPAAAGPGSFRRGVGIWHLAPLVPRPLPCSAARPGSRRGRGPPPAAAAAGRSGNEAVPSPVPGCRACQRPPVARPPADPREAAADGHPSGRRRGGGRGASPAPVRAYQRACVPAGLPATDRAGHTVGASGPVRTPTSVRACWPLRRPPCLPACLPCLPACVPCLPACLRAAA